MNMVISQKHITVLFFCKIIHTDVLTFCLRSQASRAIGAISLVTAAASAFSVLGLINTRSRNRPF